MRKGPGQLAEAGHRDGRGRFGEDLDADVVGAGGEVFFHTFHDGFGVTVGHDRVDHSVAAAILEIGFSEAESQQVVGVIGRVQIAIDQWSG